MPIVIEESSVTRTPVVRRRQIGEEMRGLLIRKEQRDRLKKDDRTKEMVPVIKSNGKPAQELVLHLLILPGSTMPVGLGDEEGMPDAGTVARLILKGGAFGQFIDADNTLKPRQVGDVVGVTSTWAQVYNADGDSVGGQITYNDEITAARIKGRNVGIYGDLTIARATPDLAQWVEKCEAAYWSWKNGTAPVLEDGDMFSD